MTLTVVASSDGYIAPSPDEPPQAWASAEEQAMFFADVEAADWAVMGRGTHLAADRPERRRIVFSTQIAGWQRPTQLWLDPKETRPADLPSLVGHVAPFRAGIILGGTRVHDWFRARGAIDRVHLTVEPLRFGEGLPIFSDSRGEDPETAIARLGLALLSEDRLNAGGTRYLVYGRPDGYS
ncbi:MAG: hypothetical protein AAF871_11505 [Pseudomonadota bacterium]